MSLLNARLIGTVGADINPNAEADRLLGAAAGFVPALLGAWKTKKARELVDEYKKWSSVHPADEFDKEMEIAKRIEEAKRAYMEGAPAGVVLAPEDELQKPVSDLDPEMQIEEELDAREVARLVADTKRRAYISGWDEELARKEAEKEVLEAYNALFEDEAAREEYEQMRRRWNPYEGAGDERRPKTDDERFFELADAVRWYRPDLGAVLDERGRMAYQSRMQKEIAQAQFQRPDQVMMRAQIALDSAARRVQQAKIDLDNDRSAINEERLNRVLTEYDRAAALYDAASDRYMRTQGMPMPEVSLGNRASELGRQARLQEEWKSVDLSQFDSREEMLQAAQDSGLNAKGIEWLHKRWRDEVKEGLDLRAADRYDEKLLLEQQREARSAAKERKEEYGVGKGGRYSPENVRAIQSIVSNPESIKDGTKIRALLPTLRAAGFDVEVGRYSTGIPFFHKSGSTVPITQKEVLEWAKRYLRDAATQQQGASESSRQSRAKAKPAPAPAQEQKIVFGQLDLL